MIAWRSNFLGGFTLESARISALTGTGAELRHELSVRSDMPLFR
jgi:hypothetical protein